MHQVKSKIFEKRNMHCAHARWLEILKTEGEHTALVTTDRLDYLVKSRRENSLAPALITVAGLSECSPLSVFGVRQFRQFLPRNQAINLFLSGNTFDEQVLIACGPAAGASAARTLRSHGCHGIKVRQLSGNVPKLQDVYAHSLVPFSDIFCYFVQTADCLSELIDVLDLCCRSKYADKYPACRFIVVIQSGEPEDYRHQLIAHFQGTTFVAFVLDLEFVQLPSGQTRTSDRQDFAQTIKETLAKSRCLRRSKCHAFSITHFKALINYALEQVAQNPDATLDLIKASRSDYPVSRELSEHISRFLKHVRSSEDMTNFAVPFIASSLILDSFPPGHHGR